MKIPSKSMHAHKLPNDKCTNCTKKLNAVSSDATGELPDPGDVTICFYCGHIMVFAEDLSLRNPVDDEIIEMAGDPRIIEYQKMIQFAKEHKEFLDDKINNPGN